KLKQISGLSDTSVVIYHTHTMEAYCKTEADRNNVAKKFNETTDNTRNVVAAGEWIRQMLLRNDINTTHSDKIHYEDRVNGVWQDCYYFGIQTLQDLLAEHIKTQLVMDIHRDGVTDPSRDKIRHKTTVKDADGNEYAQIMFVVGLNYNASYEQNDVYNPHWKDNFKLALLLLEKLEERVPGITRGISLRREAYNQHLAQNTLLVEMGFDGNLVSEVEQSSKLLGEIIAEVYS
ncbi:MAG: stage II sporulation protein P, partial [Clostridia bacterium]|nr:stage II sporulation protein P [Clostridia bacterium]